MLRQPFDKAIKGSMLGDLPSESHGKPERLDGKCRHLEWDVTHEHTASSRRG